MNRLQELIAELCPDGVEYKAIKDVYRRLKGTPITAAEMKKIASDDGEITIFAGGKTKIRAHEKDIPNANITRVPALLVQSRGVIDFVYCDTPFTFKNEMWAYTADDAVSIRYLMYCLKNNAEAFRKAASGMGSLPQISLKVTENYRIPFPPIEVQREVVRVLDEYTAAHDELVIHIEQEMELLYKQREIAMTNLNNNLVSRGYPFEPLGDHADILSGFPFKSSGYVDKGVPVCGGVSIMPGYVDWTTCRYWPSAENLGRFILKSGDIVMALDRPWVSSGFKLAQISEDDEGALLVQRTARVRGTDMVQPYIRALMEMDAFREHCAATGNTVPHVSHKKIESFMVPVPPIDEQEAYVRKVVGISSNTKAIVDNLNSERAYLDQQLVLVRNQLLSFPEKEA